MDTTTGKIDLDTNPKTEPPPKTDGNVNAGTAPSTENRPEEPPPNAAPEDKKQKNEIDVESLHSEADKMHAEINSLMTRYRTWVAVIIGSGFLYFVYCYYVWNTKTPIYSLKDMFAGRTEHNVLSYGLWGLLIVYALLTAVSAIMLGRIRREREYLATKLINTRASIKKQRREDKEIHPVVRLLNRQRNELVHRLSEEVMLQFYLPSEYILLGIILLVVTLICLIAFCYTLTRGMADEAQAILIAGFIGQISALLSFLAKAMTRFKKDKLHELILRDDRTQQSLIIASNLLDHERQKLSRKQRTTLAKIAIELAKW